MSKTSRATAALLTFGLLLAPAALSATKKTKPRTTPSTKPTAAATVTTIAAATSATTAPPKSTRTLKLGAIPDVAPDRLVQINSTMALYLSKALGVKVEYVPVNDYPAAVSLFRSGDLDLVWFGGLTSVQARLQTPGAQLLAQRDIDDDFHSIFIVNSSVKLPVIDSAAKLLFLKGLRFTFGAESSTSGRTMPEFFLSEAGLDPFKDFVGQPGYSGSHDKTVDLVQAGTYDAGVLNEQVWERRKAAGTVDLSKVTAVFRSPGYRDYNWMAGPKTDERFGEGFTAKLKAAILSADSDGIGSQVLGFLGAKKFIPADPNNYKEIEKIGRKIGLITS